MAVSPAGKGTSPSVLKGDLGVNSDGLKRKCREKGEEWREKRKKGKEFPVHLSGPVWSRMWEGRPPSLGRAGARRQDRCAVQCRG